MKILYDHQIFNEQKYGGISRYFTELLKSFNKIDSIETNISLIVSDNYYISESSSFNYQKLLPKTFEKNIDFSHINRINSLYYINNTFFDIFHPTYYDPYFLNDINNKPFIVTVHDMIHEKFKDILPQEDNTAQNKKTLVEKATKIIAISESTKKDLIDIYNIDPSKIEVVYLGNSLETHSDSNFKISNDIRKYLLFVGARYKYKNFTGFIEAVQKNLVEDVDLSIVCVGGGKFNQTEIELISSLEIADRVFQFDLDDETLSYYYSNAELFVFPSLYEGFGIPVLESFACQCPLVCSNTSSLPEIAANGAEYFDPYNKESIYSSIKKVLHDSDYRNTLVENGSERLKQFSWEKAALQTKQVYKSVL